jgi:hypothetical protein
MVAACEHAHNMNHVSDWVCTGRAHYFLCYSDKFFILFTNIIVMILSISWVGVSGCYKGRGSMCLPDVNCVCAMECAYMRMLTEGFNLLHLKMILVCHFFFSFLI